MHAWYGTWDDDGRFHKKTKITLEDERRFGWRMRIECSGPVRFREVMKLPAAIDDASLPSVTERGATISEDHTTATTIDYAACTGGWIEHAWQLTGSDPPGDYIVTVEIEGYGTHVFRPSFLPPEP